MPTSLKIEPQIAGSQGLGQSAVLHSEGGIWKLYIDLKDSTSTVDHYNIEFVLLY